MSDVSGQPLADAFPVVAAGNATDRLTALFEAHHNRLYRLARRLTSSYEDAVDLVQETFLKAARSPKSIPHGVAQEEAWLVRVLLNLRRDQWRKAAVHKRWGREVAPPY